MGGGLLSKKLLNIQTIPIIVALFVVLLSIAYSAFGTTLNISGIAAEVRIEADIRVTGISVDSYTNSAISSYEEYNVSNISMGVNLPNSDSTITYKVDVTNFGNVEMGIFAINNLPSNLEYELSGYTLQDKLCNNNQCSLGIKKEFYITIKYKDGGYNASSTTYALNLDFDFREFHTVSYVDFPTDPGYPKEVISGGDLSVGFYGKVRRIEVKIDGTTLDSDDYTFDQYNLYVSNITGNVTVTYKDTLITMLLAQYSAGTTGLNQSTTDPNVYYFSGSNSKVTNNYLWYGGHHWRVVEFDAYNDTILLISQQPLTAIYPGTSKTYLNSWLSDYFYNSLDSRIQNNIVNSEFNTGIYPNFTTESKKVGLLDVKRYDRAGEADSYLDIKDYWYTSDLITNTSTLRAVYYSGMITTANTSSTYGVRPVIRIKDIVISEGEGTLTSNYKSFLSLTTPTTSAVQVGEYINVATSGSECGSDKICTFRVVSKESSTDTIKVVLNGLAETTQSLSMEQISSSSSIYNILNPFATNLGSYLYTGHKPFYNSLYHSGYPDYRDVLTQGTYIPGITVGVPYAGEMFSGNDIDLSTSSSKTFVNVNTIENPTKSTGYWLSTFNESTIASNMITNTGALMSQDGTYGVRPSVHLNSWIIVGGDGSAENPYELEEPPVPVSFAEDSWDMIAYMVRTGKASEVYNVGDTKEVTVEGYSNGREQTFTVRIANMSTPEECNSEGFSQTACGFVIEFVDIITKHKMNSTKTNVGGWPASEMYSFVNEDIYNALPSDLRNIIIDTYTVSSLSTSKFISTDKLYLLSTKEVYNSSSGVDETSTRQLDYYNNNGVTKDNYSGAKKPIKVGVTYGWWLRTAISYPINNFNYVTSTGRFDQDDANATKDVSPAFRIG